jgi:hypothetical protein
MPLSKQDLGQVFVLTFLASHYMYRVYKKKQHTSNFSYVMYVCGGSRKTCHKLFTSTESLFIKDEDIV